MLLILILSIPNDYNNIYIFNHDQKQSCTFLLEYGSYLISISNPKIYSLKVKKYLEYNFSN